MSKKTIIITALIAGLMLMLNSCYYDHGSIRGYGQSIEVEVNVNEVTGVEIDDEIDVEIIPSDTFRVVIVAQENIANLIIIEEFGNVAKISYKPRVNVNPTDVAKVVFYMPELRSIKIDGSGDVFVFEEYEFDDKMEIKINGSGDLTIESIICNKLETTINGSGYIDAGIVATDIETIIRGSGNVEYYGSAVNHTIKISGSGDIEAFDLFTESTFVNISGSGDVSVWVEELLDIYISGSGNVTYKGNPQLTIDIPGSGNVISWK